MTLSQLIKEVLRGRPVLVGEYRGVKTHVRTYVDENTGETISRVLAHYSVEIISRGNLERVLITEPLPDIVEKPEEANFPYVKGTRMVFFVDSLNWKNGSLSAYLRPGTKPEMLEMDQATPAERAGDAAAGAPVGARAFGFES